MESSQWQRPRVYLNLRVSQRTRRAQPVAERVWHLYLMDAKVYDTSHCGRRHIWDDPEMHWLSVVPMARCGDRRWPLLL